MNDEVVVKKSALNPRLDSVNFKDFMTKLLNGVAIGIVIGLIPNALTGEIFKALANYGAAFRFLQALVFGVQFTVPILVGVMVAVQFKMNPIEIATLGATTFISSGVVSFTAENGWAIGGIGDLINTMLVAAVGVIALRYMHGRLGSLTMILLPVIITIVIGGLGWAALPYVKYVTTGIGSLIAHFMTLQPLLMSILLAVSFAIIIVSPVSTVAIAIAVGLSGLASGAANLGIASCAMTLVVGSMYVNKIGISLTLFLGSMKLFMGNWLRNPIMNIPIILNGIVAGVLAWAFNIQGTPQSAGFGFSGLVGPINAYHYMTVAPGLRVLYLFLVYFVFLGISAYLINLLLTKVLKLYKHEIFLFEAQN